MSKYSWSGGLEENILGIEVVACRDGFKEQPKGLVINREPGFSTNIDADERFMIVLKLNGIWVASLHPHEVIKRSWENK